MSSVNVTQLIEKEKLTEPPTGFWRKEDNREQVSNDPVFNNCLTETVPDKTTGNDALSVNPECQAIADDVNNTWTDAEEDSGETAVAFQSVWSLDFAKEDR